MGEHIDRGIGKSRGVAAQRQHSNRTPEVAQAIRVQLANSVYRTLVSLVGAMVKHMPAMEALEVVEKEVANIRKDLEKSEKKAARKAGNA